MMIGALYRNSIDSDSKVWHRVFYFDGGDTYEDSRN